ncbi:hypothetical protein [Massilia niastensis]|uniref:hypothetical protein n=1 Tax=Massilia niastensis TaxID=544911 RepID=UPI00037877BE|nr:hypothetical protein [Massilia niastensis]
MNDFVDNVQRVADTAGASREQSTGIGQVNQAVVRMDEVTQSNAALVEQADAATQGMQAAANNLMKMVRLFKLSQDHIPTAGPTHESTREQDAGLMAALVGKSAGPARGTRQRAFHPGSARNADAARSMRIER